MIHIECEQNSEQWWLERLGVPTASNFDDIVTPPDYRQKFACGSGECAHTSENAAAKCKKGDGTATKYIDVNMTQSASYYTYMNKLLGEWRRGKPDESFQSEWMKRGHELEAEALDYYRFMYGDMDRAGICFESDKRRYGCSPDGLTYKGGLEIKCLSPGVFTGYELSILRAPNARPIEQVMVKYRVQVLGSLLVTGHDWWDFMAYHPDLEDIRIRVWRKDVHKELKVLESAVLKFHKQLEENKQLLKQKVAA